MISSALISVASARAIPGAETPAPAAITAEPQELASRQIFWNMAATSQEALSGQLARALL